MGAGRTLVGLIRRYQDLSDFSIGYEPPTTSHKTVETWSSRFKLADRGSDYDETWETRKNELREQAFNEGLALDFERIAELKHLALLLRSQIYERGVDGEFHNLWVPDVKQIGSGD